MSDDVKLSVRQRRALYRAAHRGTKEMDWLLGRFADATVGAMGEHELAAFEQLLELPDKDVERWILEAPEQKPDGPVGEFVARLRRFHGLDA